LDSGYKQRVSNTWTARAFCAAHDAFSEISINWHLRNWVWDPGLQWNPLRAKTA